MLRLLLVITFAAVGLGAACMARSSAVQERTEFWAFTGPWDRASNESVREFGGLLDVIVTGWLALDSATARPILPALFPDTVRPGRGTPQRMVLVTSWHGDRFHARTIRTLARDPARLAATAQALASHAAANGYRGMVLDFEALDASDLPALLRVAGAVADSARRRAVSPIVLAIPATDTAAYPARRLLEVADLLLVMLYDQHWAGSEPGPISDPKWFSRALDLRLAEVGPDRLVAGLPTYGYRWRRGAPTEPIGFAEAHRVAVAARVPLQRDAATSTLRARLAGAWDIWVTDAELLRRLVASAQADGVRRFALWRLGQEDPNIWGTVVR
jgi:spore germination protein YaaH